MKKKIGISGKCLDGSHILMMDFDIPEGGNRLLLSVQLYTRICGAIRAWGLPDVYILKTKHGYHVVCMAKFDLPVLLRLYGEFKGLADGAHIRIGGDVCKRFILRVGDEILPYAVSTGFNEADFETSMAHQSFFSHFYDMPMRKQKPDRSHVVVFELWE